MDDLGVIVINSGFSSRACHLVILTLALCTYCLERRDQIKNQVIIVSAALRRYSIRELGATILECAGTLGAFHHTGQIMSRGWGLECDLDSTKKWLNRGVKKGG